MDMAEMNTEAEKREYAISTVKPWSTSVNDILNYVEPEIATILDKAGARVHILRAELFSNVENFLNYLNMGSGDEVIVVTSVRDASMLPTITRTVMAKGAIVRTFISYKLPASTFVIGIVKGLNL